MSKPVCTLVLLTLAASGCGEHPSQTTMPEPVVAARLDRDDITQLVVSPHGARHVFVLTVRLPDSAEQWVAAEWSPSLEGEPGSVIYAMPGEVCLDPRRSTESGEGFCGERALSSYGAAESAYTDRDQDEEYADEEVHEVDESSDETDVAPDAADGAASRGGPPLVPRWEPSAMRIPGTQRSHVTIAGIVDGAGPKRFVFRRVPSNMNEPSAAVATLAIELPSAYEEATALHAFGQVQGEVMQTHPTGVGAYLAHASGFIYGLDARSIGGDSSERRTERRSGMFSVFTGTLATRETLGLEAMFGSLESDEARGIPLARILGPSGGDLPFRTWLGNATPVVDDASSLVPHDAWFLHFSSFGKLLRVLDAAEDWGTDLMHTIEPRARDFALRARYQELLALEVTELARLFGDRVIDDVTMTGHDVFFRDGTDLTLILHLSRRDVARTHLERTLDRVGARHGATATHETVAGIRVSARESDDGRVRSYAAFVDDWAIVSTSKVALARVLETRAGRLPSLAGTADFRYVRTQMPGGDANEDGLLYFGDDFVRSLVSPAVQIADNRRILCSGHQSALAFAALAHHRDRGETATMESLVARRYLGANDLACPDGGAYAIEGDVPHCSVHGAQAYLTPTLENRPTHVSDTERIEYQAFADAYDGIFQHAIDPVAVQFRVGESIEAELLALPLVGSSEYTELRALLGDADVAFADEAMLDSTLVSLGIALRTHDAEGRPNELVRSVLRSSVFERGAPLDVARWLGSSLTIHVRDDVPLFTIDADVLHQILGSQGGGVDARSLGLALVASAVTLPVYVSVPIHDRALAQRAVDELVRTMRDEGDGFVRAERYVLERYHGETIHVLSLVLGPVRVHLYSGIVGDQLVIATRRDVLTDLLDAGHAGHDEHGPSPYTGHARLRVRPDAFVQVQQVLETEWQEALRHGCHNNLAVYELVRQIYGAEAGNDPERARDVVGHAIYCPEGGRYDFDPGEGGAFCTLHGRPGRARQALTRPSTDAHERTLHGVRDVDVGFAFTEQGIRVKLRLLR